jgi:hypothetical protein
MYCHDGMYFFNYYFFIMISAATQLAHYIYIYDQSCTNLQTDTETVRQQVEYLGHWNIDIVYINSAAVSGLHTLH